jgi:hypothetical protein
VNLDVAGNGCTENACDFGRTVDRYRAAVRLALLDEVREAA